MKLKLTLIIFMFASICLADKYFVIAGRTTMSSAGKQTAIQNVKTTGGDTKFTPDGVIWSYNANTNVLVRIICVRADDFGIKNWKNITLAQVENRIEVGLSEADKLKLQVMSGKAFHNNFTEASNP